jgi:hypothetical protein
MKIKIINISLMAAFALLVAVPQTSAVAQSCLPYLTKQDRYNYGVQLVTLNKNGVASSSSSGVSYREGIKIRPLGFSPAQWSTDNFFAPKDVAKQLFSDRASGGSDIAKIQPFDITQADLINVVITVQASPQVTVTLRTWGNTKAVFRGTCSTGGIIHGSTPDVDYLLFLTKYPVVG